MHPKARPLTVLMMLAVSVLVGVAAVLLAPAVNTRADANSLTATFGVLLAAVMAAFAVYVAIAKSRVRTLAVVVAAVGCVAAVAGLLRLPLSVYKYLFGVAIGSIAHSILAIVVLLVV